ncbi:MAG: putative cobaltochelatase [Methanospirillaceae archaeon]|nr:putative cobaltochelatase [Methanospirillaceae archaeon]
MEVHHRIYPFSAIVGQDQMKKALILNAVNPGIGGVLIRGEKGTAKSTAVRGLAYLLPDITVSEGCSFHCDPQRPGEMCQICQKSEKIVSVQKKMSVVELPVSATEDKVVGTIDIEHAIKAGEKRFEPGILAQAHRNILYIDEVNLLNDHIVDLLLDVAAMGVNIVEREGISFEHPSVFILVGTMNPEEGDLRPQLLDRFGLCVDITGIMDPVIRMEVVKRRLLYESDTVSFLAAYAAFDADIHDRIIEAKKQLCSVNIPDEMLEMIVGICIDMGVDGHRADITMVKTAKTIAAYASRDVVIEDDVREAAELVLPHRMKRRPFSEESFDKERLEESINKHHPREEQPAPSDPDTRDDQEQPAPSTGITRFEADDKVQVKRGIMADPRVNRQEIRHGRGRSRRSVSDRGHYVRSRIPSGALSPDIALDATIRAAAPYQVSREGQCAVTIQRSDIREKVREEKIGNTMLFVVDASGSMGVSQRMSAVKGAIFSLLLEAYQHRDRVGLITFRGDGSEVLLPPTSSVELARSLVAEIPTGGRTPLSRGLMSGLEILNREQKRNPDSLPLLVLVSDGKANVSMQGIAPYKEAEEVAQAIREAAIPSLVIDTEQGYVSFGLAKSLAGTMGGRYVRMDEITSESIAASVRGFGM